MGLFDKKYCDICGEKIGLLGNRKLEEATSARSVQHCFHRGSLTAEVAL